MSIDSQEKYSQKAKRGGGIVNFWLFMTCLQMQFTLKSISVYSISTLNVFEWPGQSQSCTAADLGLKIGKLLNLTKNNFFLHRV